MDFHLKGNSFSRWKYRQVDAFIAASEAIRQMLLADGVPADRTVTVHEGIDVDHVVAAPPVNVHEAFWLPHRAPVVGHVAALVPPPRAHLVRYHGVFGPASAWRTQWTNCSNRCAGGRTGLRVPLFLP